MPNKFNCLSFMLFDINIDFCQFDNLDDYAS